MSEYAEDKLIEAWDRYRKLIKDRDNTTDIDKLKKIEHDMRNVQMIIDFYESKEGEQA